MEKLHSASVPYSFFFVGEITYDNSLNVFMITHNVYFTLLALGLKKEIWSGGGGNTP